MQNEVKQTEGVLIPFPSPQLGDLPVNAEPRVQMLRNAARMTRADLAEGLGVDAATVGRWERGREAIPPRYVSRLAKLFGVSPTFLLGAF